MIKIRTHGGPGGKTGLSFPAVRKTITKKTAPKPASLEQVFQKIARHVGQSVRDLGASPLFPRGGHGAYTFASTGNDGCNHGGPSIPADGVKIKNGRPFMMTRFHGWTPDRGWRGFPPSVGSLAGLIRDRGARAV